MLIQCWASVVDGGPTLNQRWVEVLCGHRPIYSVEKPAVTTASHFATIYREYLCVANAKCSFFSEQLLFIAFTQNSCSLTPSNEEVVSLLYESYLYLYFQIV